MLEVCDGGKGKLAYYHLGLPALGTDKQGGETVTGARERAPAMCDCDSGLPSFLGRSNRVQLQ